MPSDIVPTRPSAQPARSYFGKLFTALLIYYWMMRFTQGDSTEIISSEIAYYLYVAPATAFAVGGLAYIFLTYSRIESIPKMLLIFGVLVASVSIARTDIKTALTIGLMAINIAVIFQVKPRISLDMVNILFLAAILITTLLFFAGFSLYTFIPGLNAHTDLVWRVSAYPSVAEGGLFAMVVFIGNLAFRSHRHRLPMIFISAYMLLLSGNRTGIVAASACGLYAILQQYGALRTTSARRFFFLTIVMGFVLSVFFSEILFLLPFADSEIMKTLIFRDEGIRGLDLDGQVSTAAVREWIMTQHLAVFTDSPLIGIGTFDFAMLNTGYGVLDNSGTGSEAFVTYLLARIGLLSVPFFAALFLMHLPLGSEKGALSTYCRIGLMFGMITYGSFVNVYDIVFLLLILGIAGCVDQASTEGGAALQPRTAKG